MTREELIEKHDWQKVGEALRDLLQHLREGVKVKALYSNLAAITASAGWAEMLAEEAVHDSGNRD